MKPLRPAKKPYPEEVLRQKKDINYDKNQKLIYFFFCEKPVWKPVKS